MKILLAALTHETQCFIPEINGADRFRTLRGDEILGCGGDGSTIDGFLEVAQRQGWTVIPTVGASAMSSGRVADAGFEVFWREVEAVARPAIAEGIDRGAAICPVIGRIPVPACPPAARSARPPFLTRPACPAAQLEQGIRP